MLRETELRNDTAFGVVTETRLDLEPGGDSRESLKHCLNSRQRLGYGSTPATHKEFSFHRSPALSGTSYCQIERRWEHLDVQRVASLGVGFGKWQDLPNLEVKRFQRDDVAFAFVRGEALLPIGSGSWVCSSPPPSRASHRYALANSDLSPKPMPFLRGRAILAPKLARWRWMRSQFLGERGDRYPLILGVVPKPRRFGKKPHLDTNDPSADQATVAIEDRLGHEHRLEVPHSDEPGDRHAQELESWQWHQMSPVHGRTSKDENPQETNIGYSRPNQTWSTYSGTPTRAVRSAHRSATKHGKQLGMAADHDTTKSSASDPNPTGLTSPPAESEAHPRQERSTLDPVANQIGSETTDGWHVAASARASRTRNPIRELVQNWRLVPNPLYEPIDLSIGDPTAYGNIKPPLYLVDHMMDVLRCGQHHGYTHSAGMEAARAAVASHFNRSVHGKERTSRDVLLTSGVSGALELALSGLLNEGDNILVPCPGFPLLRTIAEHLGACVRTYPLLAEQGWQIDLKCLDALVDGRTRALVVNNPSNPCGSVWTAAHMEDILRVAAKLHLPILSDEVYADMAFPSSRFHSFGALSRDVPVISVGGISKQFAVPGWRLGWVILHDANRILERAGYRDGLQRLSTRMLLPNALAQAVLPVALGEEKLRNSYLRDFMEHLATNASLIDEKLANTSGVRCIMPQGAMYLMIQVDCARFRAINNTMEFCQQLYAAESVLTLPGECFGASGFVRVVTFPPKQVLAEACMRIERFCSNHKQ